MISDNNISASSSSSVGDDLIVTGASSRPLNQEIRIFNVVFSQRQLDVKMQAAEDAHHQTSLDLENCQPRVAEFQESSSNSVAKKNGKEPVFKKPRMETPSPLQTVKVRKENLGALQQLVSPFGKTDKASVLGEAIEYIKFLHLQVNALSTPYLKNRSLPQQQQGAEKGKNQEGSKQLWNRGPCLIPISYPTDF